MEIRRPLTNQQETKRILKILARVQRADRVRLRSRRRFASYRFLRSVFRAYLALQHDHLIHTLPDIAYQEFAVPKRKSWHPIRVILEANSRERDLKTKSKWTRALESAEQQEVSVGNLFRHFRQNGGIAGCAKHAARIYPKRRCLRDDWADDYEVELP